MPCLPRSLAPSRKQSEAGGVASQLKTTGLEPPRTKKQENQVALPESAYCACHHRPCAQPGPESRGRGRGGNSSSCGIWKATNIRATTPAVRCQSRSLRASCTIQWLLFRESCVLVLKLVSCRKRPAIRTSIPANRIAHRGKVAIEDDFRSPAEAHGQSRPPARAVCDSCAKLYAR